MSSTDDRGTEGTARAGDVDARVVITPRVREEGRQVREGARALVFKPSRLTIAVALVAVVGALPLLLSVPFFWLSLLIPAGIVVWVLRTRTTVDPDELTVRTVTSSRTVRWDDVRGLRLGRRSSVNAVRTDDTELTLAAVKVRDLPALSLASGGRVADPAGD
ncbi:PH domain-containing protein [Pseudonocardia ammonioxydans]|uniref:PH domain-containing protein n=1 Tax=Pseudonocardia ammonioxydans TaxID=260086 RepID=A0A1I5CMS8_PSUAM|nr:PH domain-containing protein [Pseudonocardia ammonioxydans]SFN88320.1 PH domain-containing protein [Pseudonocardia ammonioxydans]